MSAFNNLDQEFDENEFYENQETLEDFAKIHTNDHTRTPTVGSYLLGRKTVAKINLVK